jgi:arsenite oxidase small subunit
MADERRFTRKQVLVAGGVGAAAVGGGAAAVVIATRDGDGADYPRFTVAKVADVQPNRPVSFEYPLKGQQSILLDLDEEIPGGIGDKNSIVAYSVLCQHMGCPVPYKAEDRQFQCPCHQTKYDPAREGYVIQGVAQEPLPRIVLEIDGDDIVAVGVNGLIYGYRENLAPGEKVA